MAAAVTAMDVGGGGGGHSSGGDDTRPHFTRTDFRDAILNHVQQDEVNLEAFPKFPCPFCDQLSVDITSIRVTIRSREILDVICSQVCNNMDCQRTQVNKRIVLFWKESLCVFSNVLQHSEDNLEQPFTLDLYHFA